MAGSASSAAADAKDAHVYTQCPECGTVFRVTAAVLRAAQAQVRCGVCDAPKLTQPKNAVDGNVCDRDVT